MKSFDKAVEIYTEAFDPNKKIDPDKIIEIIKDNWWWISLIGEKLFKLIVKWWNKRKKKP